MEDSGGLAAASADLQLRHFHWKLPVPQGGKLQQHDFVQWWWMIPMSLWGRAAGMGFSATQSATLLQEDLWLFCFVYLSVSILTVIWTADSLGPISLLLRVASAPCFLFGSFDSLNFHLSSLPLFLLLLMSHLTALGDQENRKPKSVCFLSHLPPPQRDVPVCFFKNELNIFMFYFSLSVETLG